MFRKSICKDLRQHYLSSCATIQINLAGAGHAVSILVQVQFWSRFILVIVSQTNTFHSISRTAATLNGTQAYVLIFQGVIQRSTKCLATDTDQMLTYVNTVINFWSNRRRKIPWPAERLSASEEVSSPWIKTIHFTVSSF